MKRVVLLSGIGKSDPVRGGYDGGFMHILRHYRPEKAYIFLTAEMCVYDETDNRYELFVKKLLPDCEVIKLKNPEVDNPQDFEIFYDIFSKELGQIRDENPECDVLLNMSSGTPQMKSALYLICALSREPVTGIQVMTPEKAGNQSRAVGREYNLEEEWDNLVDNHPELEPEMRCKEVTVANAWAIVAKENIVSLIENYDYQAAWVTARRVEGFVLQEAFALLEAGARRIALDYKTAANIAKTKANYNLCPVVTGSVADLFEYLLYLSVKLKKGELADFTRAVSPVLADLFEAYLKEKCGIDISRYCDTNRRTGVRRILADRLPRDVKDYYTEYFKADFKDTFLSAANMLPYIEFVKGRDSIPVKLAVEMRRFEETTRNVAAHEIREISAEWIKKRSGITAEEMMKNLKKFYQETYPGFAREEFWNSYEKLNEAICQRVLK